MALMALHDIYGEVTEVRDCTTMDRHTLMPYAGVSRRKQRAWVLRLCPRSFVFAVQGVRDADIALGYHRLLRLHLLSGGERGLVHVPDRQSGKLERH
mgnify:CR=1 FL=1